MSGRIGSNNWPFGEEPPKVISTGDPTPFATFMRGRNPMFKPHSTLGHAKSALTGDTWGPDNIFRNDSAIYEWDGANNQWVLRAHFRKGTKREDYLLWSDPDLFKQGIRTVINEQPVLEDA